MGNMIKDADLGILRSSSFLSDDIIDTYFQYLTREFNCNDILLVCPTVSLMLTITDVENAEKSMNAMKSCNKKIIVFPVNNYDGDDGSHWSTLVYVRDMNKFIHHDSMLGQNYDYAFRLYEAVKAFVSLPVSIKPKKKPISRKNQKNAGLQSSAVSSDFPGFMEYEMTPQQENGFDCGLYVLAIARAVCMWHAEGSADWFSEMKKRVSCQYVECDMRFEVLKLFEGLQASQNAADTG